MTQAPAPTRATAVDMGTLRADTEYWLLSSYLALIGIGLRTGDIFLAAAPFALIALIAVCFIREVPRRRHTGDPIAG